MKWPLHPPPTIAPNLFFLQWGGIVTHNCDFHIKYSSDQLSYFVSGQVTNFQLFGWLCWQIVWQYSITYSMTTAYNCILLISISYIKTAAYRYIVSIMNIWSLATAYHYILSIINSYSMAILYKCVLSIIYSFFVAQLTTASFQLSIVF